MIQMFVAGLQKEAEEIMMIALVMDTSAVEVG